ncbi:hypothetical protein FQN57_002489 [Myotisia sp. PD_48]|nr:hypothetical protein FQN57_002489 [Myotisia sp. PD_48]
MFRREKVEDDEVVVMNYISTNTSIPIPRVLGSGTCKVGPYIILEFSEGKPLSEYLRASQDDMVISTLLNFDIDDSILRRAYRIMAEILLELSRCRFSTIGGLAQDSSTTIVATELALTFNVNGLVRLGNLPPKKLSQTCFSTATAYLVSLAEDHLHHLESQHNEGPFPLFCDDLRPSNVLLDEDLRLLAVIDREFSYAAPAEFTHCSPWWLLLARPESRKAGFDDFLAHYIPRQTQTVFLEILREC